MYVSLAPYPTIGYGSRYPLWANYTMTVRPTLFLTSITGHTLFAVNESAAEVAARKLGDQIAEASQAWLMKSPSRDTRSNYERDVRQFIAFAGAAADQPQRCDRTSGP